MKIFSKSFALILLFVIFLLGLKINHDYNFYWDLKNEEKNKFNKSTEELNKCFDLENKSQRSPNDSIKLIGYCLEEYGSEE